MPRYTRPLAARQVQSLKNRGLYCDGGGLYLQISKRGTKSWVFRYALNGRKRDMGLGGLDTFSLAEARERAKKARQLVADAIDPIEQRKLARAKAVVEPLTFKQAAERYVAAHEAGWKAGGSKEWLPSLAKHVFPHFGDVPVAAVDVAMVMLAIEPRWDKQPVRMGIVRGRIEQILDWAKSLGLRGGENPARWRGHLENLLPHHKRVAKVTHHAAMPYAEVGDFIAKLRALSGTAARALEFQVLTAARSNEVVGAQWDEIDFGERLWVIPAERMKADKEHRVPLSDAAMAVLEQQAAIRESAYVFPGRKAGQAISLGTPMEVVAKLGRKGEVTAHGFRSSFSDWASERTDFPRETVEASLAHAVGTAVERAYRRGDFLMKRRQLMEAWSRYITSPPAEAAEVIPFAVSV